MRTHEPVTERVRRRFSATMRANAAPDAVFPLLCPVREYDWIPEWDCRVIYTESGVAEPGCVFQTDRPADGGLDTWVVSRHEPPARIEFIRVNPLRTMRYDIRLEPDGDDSTILVWDQAMTALSDEGDEQLVKLRQDAYARLIGKIECHMNEFLATRNGD